MIDDALRELAGLHGIQSEYHEAGGAHRVARPEAVLAALRALGAPLERPEDAGEALRARRLETWARAVEPVVVVWGRAADASSPAQETASGVAELRLPAGDASTPIRCRLLLEDGERREWEVRPEDLSALGGTAIDGRSFTARRLELRGPLPPGYHALEVEIDGGVSRSLVIAAPETAYPGASAEPGWGAFLPLYALRAGRDTGLGRYPDLGRLGRWVGGLGGAAVGTLPLLAAFLDRPFEPSPYAPVSRLFWNELYLELADAPGLDASSEAAAVLGSPARREALQRLAAHESVDYRELYRLQRELLAPLSRAFFEGGGERSPDYARFVRERPEVVDYARFRATVEASGKVWWEWPEGPRGGRLEPGDWDDAAARRHLYAQWLCERQLGQAAAEAERHGAALYLDLPLGAHPDGYDVWRERDSFALDASGGAPPDPFFSGGQDWGFPPLHPQRIRENGYRYLRGCLRHHLRHAGVLRIDHVMSLDRLFWIPRGMSGADGVYVRYAAEELYALVCLESRRAGAVIVGEDLGTVPDETREGMRRHGLLGMHVLPFEIRPGDPPTVRRPAPSTVASLNTHDMPTFAGWWRGADIEDRRDLELLDEEQVAAERRERERLRRTLAGFLQEQGLAPPWQGGGEGGGPRPTGGGGEGGELDAAAALRGCLRFLAASPAVLLLVNLEDLWLEERPQNVPGTSTERPNWRGRAAVRMEELGRFEDVLAEIDRLRRT